MDDLFRYLGRKAGKAYKKGRWYFQSVLGSEEEAIKAERLVGEELSAEIRHSGGISPDDEQREVVHGIGSHLAARLTNPHLRFQFDVISSGEYNAFALPGGFIFTTSNLMRLYTSRREELAFILAHEIGHVVRGHPFDRVLAMHSLNLLGRIGHTGGILGNLAASTLRELLEKGYSREQELEADGFAVRLMDAAGFDPLCAEDSIRRLAETGGDESDMFEYFSTHPGREDRIREIRYQYRRLRK